MKRGILVINIVCLDHLQDHEDITHLLVSLILVGYQMFKLVGVGSIPSCTNTLGYNITEEKFILCLKMANILDRMRNH